MSTDSRPLAGARDEVSLLEANHVDVGDGLVPWSVALRASPLRAIDALPNDVALRVLCAASNDRQIGIRVSNPFQNGEYRVCRSLRDEGRAWALQRAAMLDEKSRGSVADAVLLFALVRAGVPLEARWSQLGLALQHIWYTELPSVVAAIPAAHHLAWLATSARAGRWANDIVALAPSVALAEVQLAGEPLYSTRWRFLVDKMIEIGKSHPELAAFAAQKKTEAPEPITLVVTRILVPRSADELTPLEREQLRAAARGYDEQDLDAAARLADDGNEPSLHGGIVLRTIASAKGVPLYDAYTYAGDAGAFFRTGTMEEVAWVGQGGGVVLAEKNEPLRQALGIAIGPGAVVRLARDKKPAAKRPATKKAGARKPAAKKTRK